METNGTNFSKMNKISRKTVTIITFVQYALAYRIKKKGRD